MSSEKNCSGCGIKLQDQNPKDLGYTPKIENNLCQRCFRLKHYGDTKVMDLHGVESEEVFKSIEKIPGKIVLMVDITDIESTLFRGVRRHFSQRNLILVITKRDLIPITVSEQKILKILSEKVKEEAIEVLDAILVSIYDQKSILNAKKILLKHAKDSNLLIMGYANTGKSSFLNHIVNTTFSVSPYAHTTLDIQSVPFGNHFIYDTPGIRMEASYFDFMDAKTQAQYSISKPLKPITHQLKGDQCFFIKDIADITISAGIGSTVTLYFSDQIDIHRTKADNRDNYQINHINYPDKMYRSNYKLDEGKYDIVVKQIGWFSVKGSDIKITINSILKDAIIIREAMI